MSKNLSEMTLEELWRLFPIKLVPHNGQWEKQYGEMDAVLREKLTFCDDHASCNVMRISHIGSTAVDNIWAKPIVDILVEIAHDADMTAIAGIIEKTGFYKMSESPGRISFNYGYTEKGFAEKVYHLHLRYAGDNDELYFRDYLKDHPDIAGAYQQLKLELWHRYEYDRDGYTEAKTEFIRKHTAEAKAVYQNRYR